MKNLLILLATIVSLFSVPAFAAPKNFTLDMKSGGPALTGLSLVSVSLQVLPEGTASVGIVAQTATAPVKYVVVDLLGYSITDATALMNTIGGGIIQNPTGTSYIIPSMVELGGAVKQASPVPNRDLYFVNKADAMISVSRSIPSN